MSPLTGRGDFYGNEVQRYVDEQAFRFNHRDKNDGSRFFRVLAAVVGKRLTYRLLTAQGDAGFMGIK